MEIKVSVIVPIYNVIKHLNQCLDSLISQTLQEIEIICVDDCSTDGSKEFLLEYAKNNHRIIPIFHTKNMGTSQTRKDAVLRSRGQYIMFVDGDDFLMPDSCERAYRAIAGQATDMLQFGVNIVNCAGVPESRIAMNQRIVKPCTESIVDADLIRLCWEEKRFRFSLWNKIYRGEICRKAFGQIENGYFLKGEDLYAFFVIAFLSKSTAGIEEKLYNYNFGVGITGGNHINLRQFDRLLDERTVYEALYRFLTLHQKTDFYALSLKSIYDAFLSECVNKWAENLRAEYLSEGFDRLIDVWGFKEVLCTLAEKKWNNRLSLAEKIVEVDYFSYKKKDIENKQQTIAIYYRNIKNGGAQRVVANLCNIWANMKDDNGEPLYHIILITDEEKLDDEYYLDERIIREFLPANEVYIKDKYRERFDGWERILSKHSIDIVVSGMWVVPCTFWDMLCVKGYHSHPAFVIHAHSFFGNPYQGVGSRALEQNYLYQICDGVVTLSECDRSYVSTFCPHTKYIINPITFTDTVSAKSGNRDNHTILWIGRISKEKQPMDAIEMMEYVVSEIPDAKLLMVGSGDEQLFSEMMVLIEKLNLQNTVILPGFQTNVDAYYKNASVCIITSAYEGFSLTLGEALFHALPIVSYEMPWLSYMRDGRGIISVKQHRVDLLAKEVADLLKNPKKRQELGASGQQQIIEMQRVDIGAEWKDFFDGIGKEVSTFSRMTTEAIIYKYLAIFQQTGKDKVIASKNSFKKENQLLEKKCQSLEKKCQSLDRKRQLLDRKLEKINEKNASLKKKLESTQSELGKIKGSLTWRLSIRIVAPWRKMKKFIKKRKGNI